MAKKPQVNVHVQSSDFKSLLQAQKESLTSLKSIEEIMKVIRLTDFAQLYETKKIDDENDKEVSLSKDELRTVKEQLKVSKKMADDIKGIREAQKARDEESEAIANIAKSIQTFKTLGEKFQDLGKKMKDTFSPSGMKTGLMKTFNIGGIFNKSIEREKFIKQQKAMNPTATRKELAENFEGAYKSAKQIKKSQKDIEDYKKLTGLSEAEMSKYAPGREKLAARAKATDEYAKYDIRAAQLKENDKTPTQAHADEGQQEEQALEDQRLMAEQSDLLVKIEQNTRGASPDQKAKPAEEGESGGLLGKLMGGGMGKALGSLKQFGVGIILVSGALWVASKAFQSFAEVAWEDVGKGLVALGGLVLAAIGLDKVKGNIIAGSAALGVLALATWGIGAALKTFSDLDWETIGKGFVAVAGLGVIGAIAGTAAPLIATGAAALGLMGAAVWVAGEGFQAMNEAFSGFADNLERLAQIDGMNLLKVAAGVAALGPAMALFAAGNVAAGLSNLVTGFLSAVSGQKTPVEQLIEIGKAGEGVEKAGLGMKALGEGMKAFSDIKGDSLKALKQFPWEEATKFVAAGGQMSADGARVYNASKGNADESAKTQGTGGGNKTNVVNAPITNTSNTTQVYASAIRNQESSQSRYLQSRFADF